MIRKFLPEDLSAVMNIWLSSNLQAHNFIDEQYWKTNYSLVKEILPQAEISVFENEKTGKIEGFIGLNETHIEGIFVSENSRSKGIGKSLLDATKSSRNKLSLNVYQKNERAIRFYKKEGFIVQEESLDENVNEKEFFMVWRHKDNVKRNLCS